MKRWLGRLWRLAQAIIVIAVIVLAAWAWLLPPLVERAIEQRLRDAGATAATVQVHRMTPRRATLGGLTIGERERLSVDTADVSYRLGGLGDGRIERLTLSGAQLVLTLRDGSLEFGELAQLDFGDAAGEDWLFDRVELHHSALLIETPTAVVRLPIQGLITADGNTLTLGLIAEGLRERGRLTGQITRHDDGWTTDNLQLQLHGGDVALAGHALRNPSVQLTIDAAVDENGTRIAVQPGSRVEADGFGSIVDRFSLRVGFEPVVVSSEGEEPWQIDGGEVTASARTGAPQAGPASAEALSTYATLRLAGDADRVTASLIEPAELDLANPTLADAPLVGDWRVEPMEDAPTLAWDFAESRLNFAGRLRGEAVDLAPLPPDDDTPVPWLAAADALAVDLAGTWQASDGFSAAGQAKLTGGRFAHQDSEAAAEGVTATIPLAFNQQTDDPGRFGVERIAWQETELPGPTGAVRIVDGRAELAGQWQPIEGAALQFEGEGDAAGGRIEAELPQVVLVDPQKLARSIPALQGWEIDGGLSGQSELTFGGGQWRPNVKLTLDDLAVRSREWDAQLSGIEGSIAFDRFAEPLTPAGQQLTVGEAQIGELTLSDGLIGFRIESPRELLVERMRWTVGEQSDFRVHGFRFSMDQTEIETDVFVERMNLDDWLGVLTDEAVTGTGELFGRIPITLRPHAPRRKLVLGSGFLYARPGGGTLTVRDEQMVANLLEQTDGRFGGDEAGRSLRRQTVRALTNFEYSMITFDLVETGEGLMLRVETRGRGRDEQSPVEIGSLVVNVRGFEEAVDEVLWIGMTPQRAVDRALEGFFERVQP